jgi:hypothetical protein
VPRTGGSASAAARAQASVLLLSGLLLVGGMLPALALAADPTPTPTPLPGAGGPGTSGGGAVGLAGPVPLNACASGAPAPIQVSQFNSLLRAKVIYADAGTRSDLRVESPYQLTIQTDASVNQDAKYAGDFTPDVLVLFSIFTPAFGTTRTSNSPYARVVNEAPGVWVICFEDGSDNDFDDLIVRIWNTSCQSQTLASHEDPSDAIQVFYDPRFLVEPSDPDYLAKATWMAEGIRDEAIDARDEMADTFDLFGARNEIEGWPIKINLDCDPRAVLSRPVDGNGNTIGEDLIKLRASFLGTSMQPYLADRAAGNPGSATAQAWADLLHHELIHAYQSRKLGLIGIGYRYLGESDSSLIEGTAQFGSDLLENGDDDSNSGESFMEMVRQVAANLGTTRIVVDHYDGAGPYRSAPFQQYLAERFGDAALPTLETRGAEFMRRLYTGPTKYGGYKAAIGVDRDGELTDALRDFYVAWLAHGASNITDVPKWLRILDETTQHGAAPSFGAVIPAQSWDELVDVPVNFGNEHWDQEPTTAKVKFLNLPPNTAAVRVTVVDGSAAPGRFAVGEWDVPLRLAFLPSRPRAWCRWHPATSVSDPRSGRRPRTSSTRQAWTSSRCCRSPEPTNGSQTSRSRPSPERLRCRSIRSATRSPAPRSS